MEWASPVIPQRTCSTCHFGGDAYRAGGMCDTCMGSAERPLWVERQKHCDGKCSRCEDCSHPSDEAEESLRA